jgi:predicted nucleic acid-binding protein
LVILDSNIVIYLLQKNLAIDDVFAEDAQYCISLVTYMETLTYNFASEKEEQFV